MLDLPPSTPIEEVFPALAHPGVRTLGDLLVVIERGEINDPAVLKKLGVAPKKGKANDGTEHRSALPSGGRDMGQE